MWWNDSWPMPWMLAGPVVMLLVMAVCFTMMILMMRGMGHRSPQLDPLEILEERFARGEISQTEFEERRRSLRA